MALTISGTSNGKLGNLSLSANTGDILDSANTSFFGVDNWYLNANHTGNEVVMTAWTRASTINWGRIGTGMSVSSGHWTFPSTGIYLIIGAMTVIATSTTNDNIAITLEVSNDNFSTTETDRAYTFHYDQSGWSDMESLFFVFDCTDTSNDKIRFKPTSMGTGNYIRGFDSDLYRSTVTFIRLGDT